MAGLNDAAHDDNTPLRIMIVAGEASGDKHGAALARALRSALPERRVELFGSGGEEMRASGVDTLVDAREVAIIGIPEIARAMGKLYRAYRKLVEAALSRRPSAIVLIDWPDFNLKLARRLHREGFKIIYYISPQVWAWRKYRVQAIKRDVDRMLVILPFEKGFYERAGVKVEYVGHPLAGAVRVSESRESFASKHSLDPERPFIALLPGSREKEIHYHLPAMLDAAGRILRRAAIAPQFILPLASTVNLEQVGTILRATSESARLDLKLIERDTYNALGHAEVAVVASGTATVEAALIGTPMVIIYRASELNWRLLRPLIHLDTFGMANLVAGRKIVPELIQHDATGERIAGEVISMLQTPGRIEQARRDLAMVRERLIEGGGEASARAARAILNSIGGLL